MKAILHRLNKEETGAALVIEMTLIFPLVLFVMGFLIYMASYVMQSVTIYNDAQRIAVAASREVAFPGYEYLYGSTGVTTKADFNWADDYIPGKELINEIMNEHDPYRYWGSGFLEESEKNTLEVNLERLVAENSFLASSNVDCEITTSNNVLNQQVQVHIVKYISTPRLFQSLGLVSDISIDVTATAVVGDPAEFIRNTDMVFDLVEYMFENLKIGKSGQTVNEKIAIYKQKFNDMKAKLNLSL